MLCNMQVVDFYYWVNGSDNVIIEGEAEADLKLE